MAKLIRNKTLQENDDWDWLEDVMKREPLSWWLTTGRDKLVRGKVFKVYGHYIDPSFPKNGFNGQRVRLVGAHFDDGWPAITMTVIDPISLSNGWYWIKGEEFYISRRDPIFLEPEETLQENNDWDWVRDISTPPTMEELRRDPEKLIGWRLQNEFNDLLITKYNEKGMRYKALNLLNNQTHYLSKNFMLQSIFLDGNLKIVYNPDGIKEKGNIF